MPRKKHVLLVVRWPVGGIRTYIRYVYRHFDPSEWRFTIIAPALEEMRVLMEDLAGIDAVWVPVEGIPEDASSVFLEMTRSITANLFKSNFDLVHSHGFISGMCAAAPVFARRIPHVMTSHDVINEGQFIGVKGFLKKRALALAFGLIDNVQSVSHDAQDNLLSFFPGLGRKAGKCVVIPNGIETGRFLSAEPLDLRAELGLPDNVFLIGFFGRFMKQKGFCYLIEAMEMLTSTNGLKKQPVVIAFGDGGFLSADKRSIKEKGLEDNFYFMPFTPNIAGAIKGVGAVVMPSLWEACGLLAMETLVCGSPLITTNCIGLREVVHNTPAIKIPIHNAHAIACAIMSLMEMHQKELFFAFVPEAVQRFEVVRSSQKLKALYERLS